MLRDTLDTFRVGIPIAWYRSSNRTGPGIPGVPPELIADSEKELAVFFRQSPDQNLDVYVPCPFLRGFLETGIGGVKTY